MAVSFTMRLCTFFNLIEPVYPFGIGAMSATSCVLFMLRPFSSKKRQSSA
jgi:hypothetical protein